MATGATDPDTDPGCGRATDLDTAPEHSSGLDITPPPPGRGGAGGGERVLATSICTVSPDSNLTLGCHRWWPRPQASALPSVATGAMDNNADPGFGRPRNPAQAWMSPQPRVAAQVPQISFLCWRGRLCYPRHRRSSLLPVVTGAMSTGTEGCCSKATHSDASLGSSPGPDVTTAQGDKKASHILPHSLRLFPQDANRSAFASFSDPPRGYSTSSH